MHVATRCICSTTQNSMYYIIFLSQTTSSEYHLGPVHRLLYRRRREKKNTTIISSRIHSAAFIQSPLFQRTMTIHLSLLGSLVPPKSFLALLFSQLLSSRTTGAPLSRRSDSASPNMQVRWLSLLVPRYTPMAYQTKQFKKEKSKETKYTVWSEEHPRRLHSNTLFFSRTAADILTSLNAPCFS